MASMGVPEQFRIADRQARDRMKPLEWVPRVHRKACPAHHTRRNQDGSATFCPRYGTRDRVVITLEISNFTLLPHELHLFTCIVTLEPNSVSDDSEHGKTALIIFYS